MNEPIDITSNNLSHDLPAPSGPNIPCLSNTRKADQQTSSWMYILQQNWFFISVFCLGINPQNPKRSQSCIGPKVNDQKFREPFVQGGCQELRVVDIAAAIRIHFLANVNCANRPVKNLKMLNVWSSRHWMYFIGMCHGQKS